MDSGVNFDIFPPFENVRFCGSVKRVMLSSLRIFMSDTLTCKDQETFLSVLVTKSTFFSLMETSVWKTGEWGMEERDFWIDVFSAPHIVSQG